MKLSKTLITISSLLLVSCNTPKISDPRIVSDLPPAELLKRPIPAKPLGEPKLERR